MVNNKTKAIFNLAVIVSTTLFLPFSILFFYWCYTDRNETGWDNSNIEQTHNLHIHRIEFLLSSLFMFLNLITFIASVLLIRQKEKYSNKLQIFCAITFFLTITIILLTISQSLIK